MLYEVITGSLGPDAFPDIYVGQAYIHPAENKTSGEWLSLMLNDALALEQNSEKRYEIIAFILGFMTHYSGDLFGHTYINQIAHGAYPDMAELADPSKAENALSIITRHISSEGIIDKAIPQKYQNGEYIRIDAPNEFVLDSFIYDGTKDSGVITSYSIHYTKLYDRTKKTTKSMDFWIFITVMLLLSLGIIMVFSASAAKAYIEMDDAYYFFKKQLIYSLVGVVALLIASKIDYRKLGKLSVIMLIISLLMLVMLLIPGLGRTINGSTRWLKAPIPFQLV